MKLKTFILHNLTAPATLFIWAWLILALPNICLSITEPLSPWARMANLLVPLPLYALTLTLRRRPAVMTWWLFPLIFLSAFQMVLLYLFGRSVIAVDMFVNLVTTNVGEATELLDKIMPSIVFVVVAYVPLLTLAIVGIRQHTRLSAQHTAKLRTVSGALLVVALAAWLWRGTYKNATDELYPLNVFHNIRLAVSRVEASAHYAQTSARFTFGATSTHDAHEREVYVLVIGETARAENFQLYGYQRPTTPLLMRLDGLIAFDKAFSQSNTTHKSVPMLLSAVSAQDYDSLYHQKGIITAFREAGFHTVFISNQMPNHSFIDFLGQEADRSVFVKTAANGNDMADKADGDLLPLLDKVLAQRRTKELIVLHTYGSHFEYDMRYPKRMAHFKPDEAVDARAENRVPLVNAYDNSIRYTDWLLSEVIERLRATGSTSAMLYTSDHGENIFDDKRHLFLHASPTPSSHEVYVPLLVWTSPYYKERHQAQTAALWRHRHKAVATSLSVFHTLTDMAGIRSRLCRGDASLANEHYREPTPLYLNDHNEAVPLQQAVRDKEDWARLLAILRKDAS